MKEENYLKKNFWVYFAIYGIPTGIIIGILFGMDGQGSITDNILRGLLAGVISGAFVGAIFAGIMILNTVRINKKLEPIRESLCKEHQILHEDAANYFRKSETVGGWLFMLEDRLYFASQKLNIKSHTCEIPYSAIESVQTDKTINTFRILLSDGKKERFVVNDREDWIRRIEEQLQ